MTKEKSGNITSTTLVKQAGIDRDPTAWNDFIKSYVDFLTAIIWKGCIFAGRGTCSISAPAQFKGKIIDELKGSIAEVCHDFLTRKVTPDFIAAIRKTHRGEAGRHVSVRTTLQYMLVNKLKKNTNSGLIVKCEGRNIEIYLKSDVFDSDRTYFSKEEVREMLRHFRCLLTRLAGKGDISVYPTPYECYCLYHDCFGTNRMKVVQAYVPNPEEQQKFLNEGDWNDTAVGALLAHRYQGKKQLRNNRKISCERKTINNRRLEYQERLSNCILNYLPDADPEEIRQMLNSRDVDVDIVNHFFLALIGSACETKAEAASQMKTRTLEAPK